MSYSDNPVQGSFIGRTKSLDKPNTYQSIYKTVGPSETYYSTGSNANTGFMLAAGSKYKVVGADGSGAITVGLVAGTIYPIALSHVSCSSTDTIHLMR
jgi:hypothetical protein